VLHAFDCGQPDLNARLIRYALQNQSASSGHTYVGLVNDSVVGYYSLAVGQVEYSDASERLRKRARGEAVARPNIRFASQKSIAQEDLECLHRPLPPGRCRSLLYPNVKQKIDFSQNFPAIDVRFCSFPQPYISRGTFC